MMKKIDLCDAGLLKPFVGCLERRCLDADKYLEKQFIPPEMVAAGNGLITRRQAWRFFGDIVRNEGVETIGFLDDDPYSISNLGPIAPALRLAVNLRDAMDTFGTMISRITSANTVWLEESPEQSWFCCRGEGLTSEEYPTDHFTVMALAEIVRLAAGPKWRPTAYRLHTGHTRALDRAALVADVEPRFHRNMSAVRFPTALLARPLEYLPSEELDSAFSGNGVIDTNVCAALTELLKSSLQGGMILSSHQAAEILGVHRSTLYRALNEDGLTWRKISDRVRYVAALDRLRDPKADVKAIAFELGYSDPSNFSRAFLRLGGISPTAFRKRAQGND